MSEVRRRFEALPQGDPQAAEELLPLARAGVRGSVTREAVRNTGGLASRHLGRTDGDSLWKQPIY